MKLNKHQELVRDHYCRGEYSYVTDTSQIVPSWSGDGLFTFLMLEAGWVTSDEEFFDLLDTAMGQIQDLQRLIP